MREIERLFPDEVNRRAFMARMAAAGLGAAAMGCLARPARAAEEIQGGLIVPDPQDLPGIPGADREGAVLNYALTLELLESDLYRQALNHASGRDLRAPLEHSGSAYELRINPGKLDAAAARVGFMHLVDFAMVEAAHRDFVRAAVEAHHSTPVRPNPGGYRFPDGPGDTLDQVLNNLLAIEETGVRAYLGASTLIDNFDLLTTAASIYSSEASHCSAIRVALGQTPGPVKMPDDQQAFPAQFSEGELEYYRDPKQVLQEVQPYLVK
jgi:hypothetical protein